MEQKSFKLILERATEIAPQLKHFTFVRPNQTKLAFIPGQFITLLLPYEGKTLRRSYSIASHGHLQLSENPHTLSSYQMTSETIEFAATYVEKGRASEFLFHLRPGDEITVGGPFGRLVLRDDHPGRYVLIATGTGVTPYRSMLPELQARLEKDSALSVVLCLGVRSRDYLLYGEEFAAFQSQQPRFQFHAFYSRALPDEPAMYEHQGYVQHGFDLLDLNSEKDLIYLCGNPNMIDEAFTHLQQLGFASNHIRREKYISSS